MRTVEDTNYFQIQGWMRTQLNLKGNELIIYAIIYGFSQDNESRFYGNIDYLSEFAGTSRKTTITILHKLLDSGLVERTGENTNHGIVYTYSAVKGVDFKRVNSSAKGVKMTLQGCKNDTSKVQNLHSKGVNSTPNNKYIINNNKNDTEYNNKGTHERRFQKPTVEEIQEYARELKSNVDAHHFYDYYESIGWRVGKNPMKDWKACVRTWERNGKRYGNAPGKKQNEKYTEDVVVDEAYFTGGEKW